MDKFEEWMRERESEAEVEARESHKTAMNSYGAGYERGYVDALIEARKQYLDFIGREQVKKAMEIPQS